MNTQELHATYTITPLKMRHYQQVVNIYEKGMATGNATFEAEPASWERWDTAHLPFGRLVIVENGDVAGWAALTKVSGRCVYSGVAEISVYIHPHFHGRGMGKALLNELIRISEENGIWTLQAGIMKENIASLALHFACGFREVGFREKLGKLNGVWRDVYLLERRSQLVGVE
jgi:L-amino acid N-acyltransferase YncA